VAALHSIRDDASMDIKDRVATALALFDKLAPEAAAAGGVGHGGDARATTTDTVMCDG
jgi:hypothetical protein